MQAREALDLMAQAIEQAGDSLESAVVTIAPSDGNFASDRLPVLRSPTYGQFVGRNQKLGEGDAERVDLQALAAASGLEAARRKVADIISVELARVLHLREEDISQVRPLGEIGLDSLMAVELVMNLEQAFGTQIPLGGPAGAMTIADIADEVIAYIGLDRDSDHLKVAAVMQQHAVQVGGADREALKDVMTDSVKAPKRLVS